MKFGGTSLADISRINSAALKIKKEILKGYSVIVVVSAMSGTTNNLIKLVKGIDESFDLSEHDTVVSTGEQISSGLITIALQAIGIKAKSFSGWQIPIITDEHFGKASINEIKTSNIVNELKKDKVPVISGFQGITSSNRVSTLGRGGSDTSAVAIAAAFNAERCDIYTDVDGVYTTDPRIEPKAVKLNFITFEEMLELSSQGAKVLHARSVALAMNHNVKLQVLSSFDNKPGTMIVNEDSNMEKTKISGVAYSSNEAKITLYNVMDKPGQAANIFGTLADNAINVDMIVQSSTLDGSATDITFTVLETDLANTIQIIQRLKEGINFTHILEDSKVTKVSVVGSGMRTKPGIAKTMFETLARNNINIQVISTSEIKISVLISSEYTELAVRTLHEAFELDKI
tara:strand:+ start:78 stop:1283 length:1206 start_codon:yes stop_codon:yes gene_type:complete